MTAMNEHHDDVVVAYLDRIESEERVKALPHLACRAPNIEISDVKVVNVVVNNVVNHRGDSNNDCHDNGKEVTTCASLRKLGLKEFHTNLLFKEPSTSTMSSFMTSLLSLDVSNNELCDLPGLKLLTSLTRLSIQRNWFANLPNEIGQLTQLQYIDASRNFLRPNEISLQIDQLRQLTNLQVLELSYNRKIRRPDHRDMIRRALDPIKVEVVITVWEEMCNHNNNTNEHEEAEEKEGDMSKVTSYIGASAAMRNPLLLRSQLEPLSTFQLRRRLVMDFGELPTDPSIVDRACVVQRLLTRYHNEGLSYFNNNNDDDGVSSKEPTTIDINMALAKRKTIRLDGTPVNNDDLLHNILTELRAWRGNIHRGGGSGQNRERPSIDAECYMILRAPSIIPNSTSGSDTASEVLSPSRAAKRMSKKMNCNLHLWSLALEALRHVDLEFASRCSEIAITFGFTGSPHVDRQNSSPFYGLALGDFTEGTGCVAVECSARVICEVNTKNRLGKVDGRYPHWVTPYNRQEERYSLIYYDTLSAYETPGPAIFGIP
jgi:hypothetical protein